MKAIIPPPVVFLICGILMWATQQFLPLFEFWLPYNRVLFALLLFIGFCISGSGVASILKRKTVIHPHIRSLSKATDLVTTGIYRYTRNPIYLGMAIMLLGWLMFLQNWLSAIAVVIFIVFITKYQIRPEEEALEKIFGEEYLRYKTKTRRWLL